MASAPSSISTVPAGDPPSPRSYSNPYLTGVGLGLVLLAAFVVMGRGLGASGAFSSLVSWGLDSAASGHARANPFYVGYLESGVGHPLKSWLVFEVLGLAAGGLLSGALAGRIRRRVERGPRFSTPGRLAMALLGGVLMGVGSKLARGCTSGQALSGGALLALGSWSFMIMVFVGAYATAWFVRRQWT